MKKFRSVKIAILLILAMFISTVATAAGTFVVTSSGIRYVITDSAGKIQKVYTPTYDVDSGSYFVKDANNRVIASQNLTSEAAMEQFKIVAPLNSGAISETKDFLGNKVPVLRALESSDPRFQQLKTYIENNEGLRRTVGMQIEARNYKINQLQKSVSEGTKDPAFAQWLVNDLKKPVYLEIDESGYICHDSSGFVLAERDASGQISYRDNSNVNRIVVAGNSEVFTGGMKDPSGASVISHEIGHMIMDQLYESPNYPATSYRGAHSKNTVSDGGFAISEGWAEAIEALSTKEFRANNDVSSSWRLETQNNIEQNRYIFENQGVTGAVNDGILRSASDMLSTEGVNASLFYDLLDSSDIQYPFSKVCQVFETAKPQNYTEFVHDFIEMFPEDRSSMIDQFLTNTKYATVDSGAQYRYKDLHDAQQAYLSASDPASKSQLKAVYESKLRDYEALNESLYKQAVVEGKIDGVLDGSNTQGYRSVRLSETVLKSQKALGQGVRQAADSIKQSFSVKNMAVTAGTSIAINLASQLMNGEKPSFKTASQAVFSMRFLGNFVGSSLGAAAGQVVVPLIQAFAPAVVGSIAGALIPSMTALVGGNLGSSLGSGMTFKESLKAIDWVAVSGQSIGSVLGSMLGAMIPIPVVGSMLGGILGGIIGEKVFTKVASWFRRDNKAKQALPNVYMPAGKSSSSVLVSSNVISKAQGSQSLLIPGHIESAAQNIAGNDLKEYKEAYESAYKDYVKAINSGDQEKARKKLEKFQDAKADYEAVLTAISQ